MGMLLIISGAFGAFNKQAVIDVGGYTTGCIGEDMELVVKLHKSMHQKKEVLNQIFAGSCLLDTTAGNSAGFKKTTKTLAYRSY